MDNQNLQHLHPRAIWLFFFRYATSFIIAAVILGSGIGEIAGAQLKGLGYIVGTIVTVIILFILGSYIWARLSWYFWRYQLAEDAYKSERGVIFKRYVSVPYERIQNVDIYRGILDRILGLSDLQIQTAGYGATGGHGIKGFGSEGRLPGLSKQKAEELRDELIKRAKGRAGV